MIKDDKRFVPNFVNSWDNVFFEYTSQEAGDAWKYAYGGCLGYDVSKFYPEDKYLRVAFDCLLASAKSGFDKSIKNSAAGKKSGESRKNNTVTESENKPSYDLEKFKEQALKDDLTYERKEKTGKSTIPK